MAPILPENEGYLSYWILLVSTFAIFNSLQNFLTLSLTKRIYITKLSSHTFAAWTLTSAIVRLYAAYNINDEILYQITLWTFVIAFFHFFSELTLFRSANIGAGWLSPFIVSCK
ncbi:13361_t:CDS:2 [Entrophospora sp. SA101]|nr:8554_t:CDS:2 [Entrophospora candida]CAH1758931.1 8596_t:CDS:2 [Entrophospora sp. SA101]CAJ0753593.1 13361_t:CDS:2 [Entrophospora sp. SA101]CAJ0827589.1 13754_t:CDS:2 [Entrophospora sp. SA101]